MEGSEEIQDRLWQLYLLKKKQSDVMEDEDVEDCECISEVEEVDEMQLLDLLDQHGEDALVVCQRLFRTQQPLGVCYQQSHLFTVDAVRHLMERGWMICDGVVSTDLLQRVQCHLNTMVSTEDALASFGFRPAYRGHVMDNDDDDADPFRDHGARGDYIKWLHREDASNHHHHQSPIQEAMQFMTAGLENDLNQMLHLNGETEYQLAYYPAQHRYSPNHDTTAIRSRYERHRDAFPVSDLADREQRRLTTILYLNSPQWDGAVDGGRLGLLDRVSGEVVQVDPVGGRMVVFLSGAVDHEVQLCHRDRFALTAWWR